MDADISELPSEWECKEEGGCMPEQDNKQEVRTFHSECTGAQCNREYLADF
jgi:hypothetical protein